MRRSSQSRSCNVLAPAYIRPEYDLSGGGEIVPYSEYLFGNETEVVFTTNFNNREFHEQADFWTIYLLNAYQENESSDNDPEVGSHTFPVQRAFSDNRGVILFLEVNRPTEYEHLDIDNPAVPTWQNRPVSRRHEIAREVGRMFDGNESDEAAAEANNNGALMSDATKRVRGVFGENTIAKIRAKPAP